MSSFYPIYADPSAFVEQSTTVEALETGIKIVESLAPYTRGGKIGPFGGAGVGKTVLIQELINMPLILEERLYIVITGVHRVQDLRLC